MPVSMDHSHHASFHCEDAGCNPQRQAQNPQPSTEGKDVHFQSLSSLALSGRATYLARSGMAESARWLVDDLTAEFAEVGRSGVTTMQWSEGRRGPMQIGDAAMAKDALSSQGLAVGLVDAVQSVLAHLGRPATASPAYRSRTISSGRSLIAEIVAMSPFAGDPLWAEYLEFLRDDEWKVSNPTRTVMNEV